MGGLRRPFRPWISVAFFSALIALVASDPAFSQSSRAHRSADAEQAGAWHRRRTSQCQYDRDRLGNLNATYLSIAYDLSAVLDDGDEFRVLPVIGKGGGQNIKDVRFLKGVDLGITQSVLLNGYRKSNEIGSIDDKIVYLAKLFNEEMHLIVRADSGITSIDQLAGKKVNFSDIGSGTQLSSRDIFEKLGIKVQEVNVGQADAFEQLKSGEIAATILIAGKPAASMARLASGGRLPHPAGAVPQAAAGRLSAGDAVGGRLSKTDREGPDGRVGRRQRGADRLQLAEGHRSLSPHPEVRRACSFRSSPNSRRRRGIRSGRRPISQRRCRAGRALRAPRSG